MAAGDQGIGRTAFNGAPGRWWRHRLRRPSRQREDLGREAPEGAELRAKRAEENRKAMEAADAENQQTAAEEPAASEEKKE
jgi:hypothetical protein